MTTILGYLCVAVVVAGIVGLGVLRARRHGSGRRRSDISLGWSEEGLAQLVHDHRVVTAITAEAAAVRREARVQASREVRDA